MWNCYLCGSRTNRRQRGQRQISHADWMGTIVSSRFVAWYSIGKDYKKLLFFDYRVNEALHMTDEEHVTLVSLMRQIDDELQKRHDELQNIILVNYIELLLNFCQRFYNRRFITRRLENSDILMKFEMLLHGITKMVCNLHMVCPPCNIVRINYVCPPIISGI